MSKEDQDTKELLYEANMHFQTAQHYIQEAHMDPGVEGV